MARKLIVELIADPRGYTKGLETAATQTKVFGREVDKATSGLSHATRGLISGSGALHGFGRSLAFATGGFLAFEGVSKFLEDSISSARDAGVAQRSLAAQMTAVGESFTASQAGIEKASLSLEKFGFTSEDSEKALTVLERGTGSITKAIGLQGVAANLARAKNIGLSDAANVLAKVFGGQETALRRAVPGLDKNAHGLDLIREAAQKLTGQAAAATTETEKFHATLHNTEVIVGNALLPTVNKFLRSLREWLQRINETGQLQRNVNRIVRDGATVLGDLKAIIDKVVESLGGWKNALIVLGGAWLGFKAIGISSAIAVSTANIIAAGITEKAWQAALISTGWGLFAVAAGVAAAEVIAHWSTVKEWFAEFWLWMQTNFDKAFRAIINPLASIPSWVPGLGKVGKWARATKDALTTDIGGLAHTAAKVAQQAQDAAANVAKAKNAIPGGGGTPVTRLAIPDTVQSAALRPGVSVSQRNTWFDNMINRQIGRVQDITSLRGQIARLRVISGEITARIAATKDITRKLNLEDQLLSVQRTIRGDQAQITQNQKDAAKAAADRRAQSQQALFDRLQFNVDKTGLTKTLSDDLAALQTYKGVLEKIIRTQGSTLALQQQLLGVETNIQSVQGQIDSNRQQAAADAKQKADDARQKALQAAQKAAQAAAAHKDAIQFRLLGLGPTGGALVPGVANLKTRLAGIKDAVKGTFLDTSKTGSELDHIGKILAGKFGTVSSSVRAAIDQMYKDIRDKLKSHQGDQTKFRHLSSTAFVDSLGLNLTGAQRRAIEARFSTVGRGYTVPGGTSHQFTGGVTITGPVHIHGVQDIAALENQIVKRAKARPHTRRGD